MGSNKNLSIDKFVQHHDNLNVKFKTLNYINNENHYSAKSVSKNLETPFQKNLTTNKKMINRKLKVFRSRHYYYKLIFDP
jgi:hypothetical protein